MQKFTTDMSVTRLDLMEAEGSSFLEYLHLDDAALSSYIIRTIKSAARKRSTLEERAALDQERP